MTTNQTATGGEQTNRIQQLRERYLALETVPVCGGDLVLILDALERKPEPDIDMFTALEAAWGLIANAYDGDWTKAPQRWREAAERWRDEQWHKAIGATPEKPEPEKGESPMKIPCSCGRAGCNYDNHHGNTYHLPNDDPRKKPEHKRPEPEKGKGESVGASIVQKFIQEVWSDSRLAEAIDSAVADALASPPAAVRCDNAPEWDFSVTERRIITRVVASWLRERGLGK